MKLPPSLAGACSRFWSWLISPSLLFASAMLSFPAFLFQKKLVVLAVEAAAFLLLALSRRGRLRLLPSVLMIAGITLFALFSPHGQVLARWGKFTITAGALEAGLTRGLTLAGMVFLSQLALSPQLHLPGKLGSFVVDMFTLLDSLTREWLLLNKRKGLVGLKELAAALDARLYQVYWSEGQEGVALDSRPAEGSVTVRGIATALILPLTLYLALV